MDLRAHDPLSADDPVEATGPRALSPRARLLFHVQALSGLAFGTAPAALLGAGLLSLWVGIGPALVLAAAALLVLFLFAVWWPALSWARWSWELRPDALIVSHGVLFRDHTAIPLGRVQHVDVRQGPFEQWLGLARVHVHTASGLGADGVIPGLEIPDAERLRDELVARAHPRPGGGGDDGV